MRALLLAVLLAAPAAHAADFAVNAGALELMVLPPAHGGFYPYVGGSLAFPVSSTVVLIAALSLEWSLEMGRGGLLAAFTADFPLSEHAGLDANVVLVHDQPGLRFAESLFFAGVGPGASFFTGKWTISPFVTFFTGLNAPGLSMSFGVNFARTL